MSTTAHKPSHRANLPLIYIISQSHKAISMEETSIRTFKTNNYYNMEVFRTTISGNNLAFKIIIITFSLWVVLPQAHKL